MNQWIMIPLAAAAIVLLAILTAVNRRRDRIRRAEQRRLELVLQPKETVKVICSQPWGRCILTNNRILFEKKGEFTAFPTKAIQKVQGTNARGNRTTVPANMAHMTIQVGQSYTVKNSCPEFEELAEQLLKLQARRKPKNTDAKPRE